MKKQVENKRNRRVLEILMVVLLIFSMLVLSRNAADYVMSRRVEREKRVVVIDAGHGGGYLRRIVQPDFLLYL